MIARYPTRAAVAPTMRVLLGAEGAHVAGAQPLQVVALPGKVFERAVAALLGRPGAIAELDLPHQIPVFW